MSQGAHRRHASLEVVAKLQSKTCDQANSAACRFERLRWKLRNCLPERSACERSGVISGACARQSAHASGPPSIRARWSGFAINLKRTRMAMPSWYRNVEPDEVI